MARPPMPDMPDPSLDRLRNAELAELCALWQLLTGRRPQGRRALEAAYYADPAPIRLNGQPWRPTDADRLAAAAPGEW